MVPAGAVCWVLGVGCGMTQARYLWVLCAGQLPLGKPSPAAGMGLLCTGESSDLPCRQQNAHCTAKETQKQPRSLSQQGKVPGLEMGPAPTIPRWLPWGSGAPLPPTGLPATTAILPARRLGKGLLELLVLWGIFIHFFSGFHCSKQKAVGFFTT